MVTLNTSQLNVFKAVCTSEDERKHFKELVAAVNAPLQFIGLSVFFSKVKMRKSKKQLRCPGDCCEFVTAQVQVCMYTLETTYSKYE